MKRLLLLTILVIFALAACGGDNESPPSQLDAPFEDSSLPLPGTTVAPVATITPWPTPWPTTAVPSGPTITPRPSVTAVPTRDRTTGTEEPLDNDIVPGDWLFQPFTDAAGNDRTLAEFAGRAVVIHLLSASCDLCIEQERILMQAVQDRYDIDQLSDTVFVALGVLDRETPSMIETVLQQQLADNWSTVELLQRNDVSADWLAGIAGSDLLDALERDFGPEVRNPDGLVIIVIEPDGYAHLTQPGLVSFATLRDAITFYSNPVD